MKLKIGPWKKSGLLIPIEGNKRPHKLVALILVIAVLCIGATSYCSLIRQKASATEQVQTAIVSRQDLTRTLTGAGTLEPIEQFKITPLVTGKVLECTFEEGEQVEKGQLLYRIDPSEAQKNIDQAQLTLRQSQLASTQQADELDNLTVRAKQSGTVTEVFVRTGDKVEAGTKIATIRNSAVMLLTVPFNANDAASLTIGQVAKVTVNGSFESLAGTVKEIDAVETVGAGFRVTRNVTVSVPNPGALSPSASGSVQIGNLSGGRTAAFKYSAENTITASVSGKLERLDIKKGGEVTAGAVIAQLSSVSLHNQQENNAIAVQQAQVSLKNAESVLENYNITAPISGTVVTREVKAGDSLGNGSGTSSMAVIYDLSALVFNIPLDELDVSKVSVGQTVDVRVDALEGRTFQGVVTRISMAGNTDKGKTAYPVTVKIEAPPKELLPGMNVNASILIAKENDALTVPITAIQFGDVVLVKDKAGQTYLPEDNMDTPIGFHSVKVKVGISDGTSVSIKSGLQEDDIVLLPKETASSPGDYDPSMNSGEDMAF